MANKILPKMKVKPNDLKVDRTYQRPLDEKRIEAMAKELDLSRIGVPVISIRKDGSKYTIDGQHRIELLKVTGHGDEPIIVEYYEGISVPEEAGKFRVLNKKGLLGRLPVNVLGDFKAGLRENDPTMTAIQRIVDSLGLRISSGRGAKTICAVHMLEWVHTHVGNLAEVLGLLYSWCPEDGTVFDRSLLKDLSMFLVRYPSADRTRLLRQLGPRLPADIISQIKRVERSRSSHAAAAFWVFCDIYNKGTRRKLNADEPEV